MHIKKDKMFRYLSLCENSRIIRPSGHFNDPVINLYENAGFNYNSEYKNRKRSKRY